jgi:hypothetical protein
MGISLNGLTPAGTYPGLIKTGDNTAISGTPKVLSDGNGNNLPMEVSTTGVNLTGSPTVNAVAIANTTQVAAKQDTLVSGTNIKTINGTSVLGSGNIVTPSTNPSGVAGAIQFSNGSAFASDAANLFWDDTNNRLGVGTNAPDTTAHFKGGVAGSVGVRVATFEGNLPEILFKDTSNNTGFAIAKYGQIVYFVNTNASGGYSSYSGLTNSNGQWSFGGGFNPSATVHIKGSGSTSATTSLLVQNSSGFNAIQVFDDLKVNINSLVFGGNNGYIGINNSPSIDSALRAVRTDAGSSPLNISTGEVGIGDVTTYPSAIFVVSSTTRGFLPPRMTTTQINAIASPANGLEVYNTTLNCPCFYNGTSWRQVTNSAM